MSDASVAPGAAAKAPPARPRYLVWLKGVVFGVPILWLVGMIVLPPKDRLGSPDWAPWGLGGYYDDGDPECMAQRGLNCWLGRPPGVMVSPELGEPLRPEEFARRLRDPEAKPQGPYFLEYPHTVLYYLFIAPFLFDPPPQPIPAAVLDSPNINVVVHEPQTDSERALWSWLRRVIDYYRVVMLLCLLGFILLLWRGYEAGGGLSSSGWLLLAPSALYYTFSRFDIVPVFLTAASLFALGRRRIALSAFCLAVGALVKVFPGLLVPLFLCYLWRQPHGLKNVLLFSGVFGATIVLLLLPPLLREGAEALQAPYRWQMAREPYLPECTAYFYRDNPLAAGTPAARWFRQGAMLLVLGLLCLRPISDLTTLVRRCGVAVIVFVCLQIIFSPQWILWYLPFLLPLTRRYWGMAALVLILDLATYRLWPYYPGGWAVYAVQAVRLAAQLGLIVMLLLPPRAPRADAAEAAPALAPTGSG